MEWQTAWTHLNALGYTETAPTRLGMVPAAYDPHNEVIPHLWMGGHYYHPAHRPAYLTDTDFTIVVSLHQEAPEVRAQYAPPAGVTHLVLELPDDRLLQNELDAAEFYAAIVANTIKRGLKTLVRCHAGYNRSGLICGLAMRQLGYEAKETIELIRAARGPYALHNQHFLKLIIRGYQ